VRVEVNGVRLFFEVFGGKLAIDGPRMREKPTLILLHGGPGVGDHSNFRPLFEGLSDVAQVVCLDQRSNGRSDRGPESANNLAQWGDDLRAFCDALDIQRPVVLGNSFGGMVAMSYATRHPEHPGKLILSSTMARGSSHYFEPSVAMFERLGGAEIGALARQMLGGTVTPELGVRWVRDVFPFYTQTKGQFQEADAQSRIAMNRELGRAFASGEMRSWDHLHELGKIRCPVLLLAGELDPICPIACAEDIAKAIPAELLTYKRYAKCGHGAYRDTPEALEDIRRFVAE
jgi:proline iminopeptidase